MGGRIYIATMHTYIYWYTAICCCIPCLPGRGSAYDGFIVSLSFTELSELLSNDRNFSNENIETFDAISKTNVDARRGTRSCAFHVENSHHTGQKQHTR